MRIKVNRPARESDYLNHSTRVISKFLWFPKVIDCELRWLESVLIEQRVDYKLIFGDTPSSIYRKYFWRDEKWVDTPANLK